MSSSWFSGRIPWVITDVAEDRTLFSSGSSDPQAGKSHDWIIRLGAVTHHPDDLMVAGSPTRSRLRVNQDLG